MLSDFDPPSNPTDIPAWLLAQEEEIAALVVARLSTIIDDSLTAFVSTLTAAGDLSAFDMIPLQWRAFVTSELADRLGGMYLSGGVSAWIQSPGTAALPEATALAWTEVVNTNAVTYSTTASNRLTGPVADSIWNDMRLKITKAIETGASTERLAREIALMRDFGTYRAETIARTEVNGAYNAGTFQSNEALGEYGPVEKYWVATFDTRTRPSHLAADSQTVPFDHPFDVGGSSLLYPHDPSGLAEEVINCFIGSTPMEWIGDLQAITRRWYEGDLYQIITANGERLTVTPNHPILTVAGWKTAKEINLKEQLFRIGSSPQVDHMPPSIEQIYRTASKGRSQVRKGLGPMDFHGDALDGEVEIVGTDSDLLAILDSHGIEIRRQIVLARSDKLLEPFPDESSLVRSLLSQFGTLSNGTRYPTSLIGDRDQFSTLLLAQSRHSDVVRLGSGTDRQVVSAKPTDDGGPRYAESFSKGQDTHALTVETTEVVGISRFPAACHVYNLQSSTGLVISGNLISHNCRCVVGYLYSGMERPDGTVVP
jgi:hypothetical protein